MTPVMLAAVVLVTACSSSRAPECGKIKNAEAAIAARGTVMLGEAHGTVQFPQFLADMVCLAAKQKLPVTVMLEMDTSENTSMERYLSSAGTAADRELLVAGPHWQAEIPDGRPSEAMVEMLESLRRLRKAGADIVVRGLMNEGTGRDGDVMMAEELLDVRRGQPERFFLVLAGGNHVRTARGSDGMNVKWMGQYVREAGVKPLLSLFGITRPGKYFAGGMGGGVADFPGRHDYGDERFIRLGNFLPGHDGVFHIVNMTPSFPVAKRHAKLRQK